MLRTIDRYVVREVLGPFAIVLIVFTFMLMMGPIIDAADKLIARGVAWSTFVRVLPTLLPQALGVTIPMALLVALLIALGRLSEDREWVALQACGVSVYRLVRPVAVLSVVGALASAYVLIYALPDANQAFTEIVYSVLWSKADSQVKPRTFDTQYLQPKVLYVREVGADGAWKDVFLWDPGRNDAVYVARQGRMIVDKTRRSAQLALEGVTQHTGRADKYEINQPESATIQIDPASVFAPAKIAKGYNQKTIAELEADIRDLHKRGLPAVEEPMAIQQKFSIPVACLVFGVIGLALGVNSRKDGKMASFVMGIGVIFAYYILMYGAASPAKTLVIPPWSARWIPNVVLGPVGVALLVWRARFSERDLPIPWLARLRAAREARSKGTARRPAWRRAIAGLRLPRRWLPRPRILDWYISKLYLRVAALTCGGLLVIFIIADFVELSDKILRGAAKPGAVALYFLFKMPYFMYFIIPIAGLIAALVTFGLLTRNSELVVMKACGISLYRASVPLLALALLSGAVLFGLEEKVLAPANRQWKRYQSIFKGSVDPDRADMLNRGWVVSRDGRSIYHFDSFHANDGRGDRNLYQFSEFTFDTASWRMTSRLAASLVVYSSALSSRQGTSIWLATNGWRRDFPPNATTGTYAVFKQRPIALEPPDYFGNEQPDAEKMNYVDLRRYVAVLHAGGYIDRSALVQLQTKIAFPFVALVMTLIAVPFSVTVGRRGAMYGIGLGVVLAITYWVTARVFVAIGAGGVLSPALAAWAPNILFGAGAIYLVLTVRT